MTEPLTSEMRGRSVRTSTRPRRAPRISTTPADGHSRAPASASSVVLPEPLGPRMTQRSPGRTSQSTPSRTTTPSRRTPTSCRAMTGLRSVATAVTRRGGDLGQATADPADQSRAGLGPGPLAGQPEPELAPVGRPRCERSRRASSRPVRASSSGTRAIRSTRRRRSSTVDQIGPVGDGRQPGRGPGRRLVRQVQAGRRGHRQWRMKTGWRSVPS